MFTTFSGMQYERMLAADVFLFSIFSFNKIKTWFKSRSSPVMKFKFKNCLINCPVSGFCHGNWFFWSIWIQSAIYKISHKCLSWPEIYFSVFGVSGSAFKSWSQVLQKTIFAKTGLVSVCCFHEIQQNKFQKSKIQFPFYFQGKAGFQFGEPFSRNQFGHEPNFRFIFKERSVFNSWILFQGNDPILNSSFLNFQHSIF